MKGGEGEQGAPSAPGLAGMLLQGLLGAGNLGGSPCTAPAPAPGQNPCSTTHTLCKSLLQFSFQTEGIFPKDFVDAL